MKYPLTPRTCNIGDQDPKKLPCETLMSAQEAKLQGSVATYFRCSGVVNNQIEKRVLLSVSGKIFEI